MDEHPREGLLQHLGGAEVDVVAVAFPREERVQRVVDIVGPLPVHAQRPRHRTYRRNRGGLVAIRLREQRELASRFPFPDARLVAQLGQVMARGIVLELVDSVQAQPVHLVLHQPLPARTQQEVAHLAAARLIQIDGIPPRGVVGAGEVRSELRQVVALRALVVVDDVQDHAEPARVAGVDEGDEPLRSPVGRMHRVLADAVVTPTLLAGKIRDGHHLHGLHPEINQVIQMRDGRLEGALRGEGADVQLVADRAPQVRAEGDGTVEQRRIDDATRPVRAFGLAEAPGVGEQHPAIDPELVQRSGRQRFRPPPATIAARHDRLGAVDDDLHHAGVGGPHLGTGDVSHECSSDQDSGWLLALTCWLNQL